MRNLFLSSFALCVIFLGTVFPVVADDLDDALAAQKKKMKHHVYSESAQIEDLDLKIPSIQTEEEQSLDRELAALEKRLDNQIVQPQGMLSRRVSMRVPKKQENWLTPAMMNPEKEDLPDEEELSWVDLEVNRQQNIRWKKKTQAEEDALVSKLVKEKSIKMGLMQTTRSKSYEGSLRNTLGAGGVPELRQRTLISPLESFRSKNSDKESKDSFRFSSEFKSPTKSVSSFSSPSVRTPGRQTGFNELHTASGVKTPFAVKKVAPLTPLQRVRKSSRINKRDPFADELVPGVKTGIWD